jgi:hypothetical protein
MLAREQCAFGRVFRRTLVAAHHLDQDIDVRAGCEGDGIGFPGIAGQVGVTVLRAVTGGDCGDGDRASSPRGNEAGMGLDDLDHADANGSQTGKAKTQGGGGHGRTFGSGHAAVC